ncbi:hypothetical protein [Chryseobacterium flavum]|uniref:hypothetical protein n=1 Tax=Chryseobacterium flavum TaxID=415851 RepID=UPI0028B1C791|nr:hypothetical protein [Chryseobacterium flavum]
MEKYSLLIYLAGLCSAGFYWFYSIIKESNKQESGIIISDTLWYLFANLIGVILRCSLDFDIVLMNVFFSIYHLIMMLLLIEIKKKEQKIKKPKKTVRKKYKKYDEVNR